MTGWEEEKVEDEDDKRDVACKYVIAKVLSDTKRLAIAKRRSVAMPVVDGSPLSPVGTLPGNSSGSHRTTRNGRFLCSPHRPANKHPSTSS